jgi:hypothetical protein
VLACRGLHRRRNQQPRRGEIPPDSKGFVETQINGGWGKARELAALRGDDVDTISCPSAGNCTVGGDLGPSFSDYGGTNGAFVLSEHNGRWGTADDLGGPSGQGSVGSLSCPSAGNCGAGGSGVNGNSDYDGNTVNYAFVVGERDGRWTGAVTPPGLTALNVGGDASTPPGSSPGAAVSSVSCPSAGSCAAGGYYTDAAGNTQAWVDGSK